MAAFDSPTPEAGAAAPAGSRTVVILGSSVNPDVVPALCQLVRHLLEHNEGDLICDVGRTDAPDIALVGTLARLQLTARRMGRSMQLHNASDCLRDLIALVGLDHVLACSPEPPPNRGSGAAP